MVCHQFPYVCFPGSALLNPVHEPGHFGASGAIKIAQTASGTKSTWAKNGDLWTPQTVEEPLQQGKTKIDSDKTADNVGTFRTAVTGQYAVTAGTAAWCADLSTAQAKLMRGCQVMELAITPTATPPSDGNYPGRVSSISVTMFDPQASTPAMRTIVQARYAYDSNGLLVRQWDPELDGSNGSLNTTYEYDVDGSTVKLVSATPASATVDGSPALKPFTLTYDSPLNRLQTITRETPDGDDATSKIVYGVPLAGGTLPDLSIAATSTWDQSESQSPVSAVAVFTPGNGTPDVEIDDVSPGDWPYAAITYMNNIGATTNTAEFGAGQWLISTQEYNADGYPSASLSPSNRALALSGTCTSPATVCAQGSTAAKALLLSSLTDYADPSLPGVATDQWSPAFDGVVEALKTSTDTGLRTVRTHNKTIYNQGAPSGDQYAGMALPTTQTSGLKVMDGKNNADLDVRTSTTGYGTPIGGASGWILRQATSTTQNGVTVQTAFNNDGNPTQVRQPMSNGSDAGTTLMNYYDAAGNPGCAGSTTRAEWDGLVCKSGPAGQPAGQPMPTTYKNMYTVRLQPAIIVDQSGSASRTSTTTYDSQSGRMTGTSITGDQGQAVPATSVTYSPNINAVLSTSAGGKSVSTTYDSWARPVTNTDASGNTSSVTYNLAGQTATMNDGKGTYTYTYDNSDEDAGPIEHRGLVTKEDMGLDGGLPDVTTAIYTPGGSPAQVVYPNGVQAQFAYNTVGALTAKEYTTHDDDTLASWSQVYTGFGQVDNETGPLGAIAYDYDPLGRLTSVNDSRGGVCTVRTYAFNQNSDRTTKTSNSNGTAACPTGKGSNSSTWANSFDTADRQTTTTVAGTSAGSGTYTYDSFGRTTAIPGVDTSNKTATSVDYYVNDTVLSNTQGTTKKTWSIDPLNRTYAMTATTGGTMTGSVTNHYAGSGDAPAWITKSDNSTQRFVSGPGGALAVTQLTTAANVTTANLNLTNPHGDVVATIPVTADVTADKRSEISATDEYGNALPATPTLTPYQWVGAAQRNNDTLGGLIQMGSRSYNPATGRFLSTDPVPGGNPNAYTYPVDPVNGYDLDGNFGIFAFIAAVTFVAVAYFTRRYTAPYVYRAVSWARSTRVWQGASHMGSTLRRAVKKATAPVRAAASKLRVMASGLSFSGTTLTMTKKHSNADALKMSRTLEDLSLSIAAINAGGGRDLVWKAPTPIRLVIWGGSVYAGFTYSNGARAIKDAASSGSCVAVEENHFLTTNIGWVSARAIPCS